MKTKSFWRWCCDKGVKIKQVASADTVKGCPCYFWAMGKVLTLHRPLTTPQQRGEGHLLIPGWRWCRLPAGPSRTQPGSGPLQLGGMKVLIPTRPSLSPSLWGVVPLTAWQGLKSWPSTLPLLVWVGLQFFSVWCLAGVQAFCLPGYLARGQAFPGTFLFEPIGVSRLLVLQYPVWGVWGNRYLTVLFLRSQSP